MSLKSFRDARSAFVRNLSSVLTKLNYTPASLSMRLNTAALNNGASKSVVSATDIQDWISGKKIPSLYAYFKLCDFLRLNMNDLLDPNFNLTTVIGRSFAAQKSTTPKIVVATPPIQLPAITLQDVMNQLTQELNVFPASEEKDLLTPFNEPFAATIVVKQKAPKVKVPSTGRIFSASELRASLVSKHSTNPKRNDKLAYAILTSGKTVKEIAQAVGASPTAIRDYMYYGVTVPENVAKNLLKALKSCNYATLGLKYDTVKTRYIHA